MKHAEKLIGRIIFLEGKPVVTQLNKITIGADVEAHIAWPFLLQDTCPLELVVRGSISGVSDRGTVMRLRSYEFRTCGERSFFEAPRQSIASRVA